ncbi:MAG TPA: FHA domain-containing protein [Acidimicrobiia bacterium]|jgi:pSer/pThr/pTyr-binding forkhead associated (FHA) protein|nr:FHA domain-containing protein [Acidimicrobiia bacterium]
MTCPNCKAEVAVDANFCPKCGAELESDPTVVYLPLEDRKEHPLTPAEAGHIEGIRGFALVVEQGPRAGMTFVLNPGVTTVGRHPESDIFLDDVTVSRHHCRFIVDEGSLAVEDSGSTNGTYVNETRVDSSELSAADEVLVGRFHFLVVRGDA